MRHYGDITKLNGADMPIVDAIFGGSPCQDLSVAGKRAGLAGERSGLFMEQLRIVKEMRSHGRANGRTGRAIRPRYMVWENVPGAFSSNNGKDFQAVLTEICKVVCPSCPDVPMPDKGGWPHCGLLYGMGEDGVPFSIAWNIHDAQYWGVPQRRRRICALADYGGLSAGDILFDPQLRGETEGSEPDKVERDFSGYRAGEIQPFRESVSGDFEPCGETGQGTSEGTERSSDETIYLQGNGIDRAETAGCNGTGWRRAEATPLIPSTDRKSLAFHLTQDPITNENVSPCLSSGNPQKGQASIGVAIGFKDGKGQKVESIVRTAQAVDVYNQSIDGEIAGTVTAQVGVPNHSGPKIMSAGFSFGQSAQARSLGYEEEKSPTIRGGEGGNQKPVVLVNKNE